MSTLHFALRVMRDTRINGHRIPTIESHNDAIKQHGRTVVGKIGREIGEVILGRLNRQIERGIETHLVLVTKHEGDFSGHKSRLVAAATTPPASFETFQPTYYSRLPERPSTWFTIDTPLTPCALDDYRLFSNLRPLLTVVSESRTVGMLLEVD